ncbi:uncharacterized protein LOC124125447 isoform X2 [Haliotis rufescens]|uniref:uncharacterized protein LOC124125447 isoform X2 n=1 Tax=Haliotis rufescens TaxID=6454 RepID=UPI00201EEEC5|nr:uncharacterized protein LOC124125447 isoform X2 [Haliotis rufescens]
MPPKRRAALNHRLVRSGKIARREPSVRQATSATVGTIPQCSSISQSASHTTSRQSLAGLTIEAERLLQRSLAANTWATYQAGTQALQAFRASQAGRCLAGSNNSSGTFHCSPVSVRTCTEYGKNVYGRYLNVP